MFVIDMNISELKAPKNFNQLISIYFKSLITISSHLKMVKFGTFHTQMNNTFSKSVKS